MTHSEFGRAAHEAAQRLWEEVVPPPEVITGDPTTCRHAVLDECVGARWGFEDCLSCGKRFPMRDDFEDDRPREEPAQ